MRHLGGTDRGSTPRSRKRQVSPLRIGCATAIGTPALAFFTTRAILRLARRTALATLEMMPLMEPDAELSLTGQLLIAMPTLQDRVFSQTVILLCAHSTRDGAMGLVVNRRLQEPGFDDLLAQLDIAPTPPRRRITLCAGGPMESSRGFVLHSSDWSGDGSLTVDDGLVLTASLDVLREIADGQGPKQALLALGHATWSPGQLESEIRSNVWLSAPSNESIVFGGDHDRKWRSALAVLGVDPLQLVSEAGNA